MQYSEPSPVNPRQVQMLYSDPSPVHPQMQYSEPSPVNPQNVQMRHSNPSPIHPQKVNVPNRHYTAPQPIITNSNQIVMDPYPSYAPQQTTIPYYNPFRYRPYQPNLPIPNPTPHLHQFPPVTPRIIHSSAQQHFDRPDPPSQSQPHHQNTANRMVFQKYQFYCKLFALSAKKVKKEN